MTKEYDRLRDDLADMSDEEFLHVYEMTKRTAAVRFQAEAYTVGHQDAFAGRAEDNGYKSALDRKHYEIGYLDGTRRRQAKITEVLR